MAGWEEAASVTARSMPELGEDMALFCAFGFEAGGAV